MGMELLKSMTGTNMLHVPYKGTAPAMTDLLSGQIDAAIDQIPASIGHIRSGKLLPIVVTSARRASQLPDTPTLQQSGVSEFDAATPLFLMAPAGTPDAIVSKLNAAVADAIADPALREKMAGLGAETEAVTPAALTAFLQKEDAAIAELAKSGLLKAE